MTQEAAAAVRRARGRGAREGDSGVAARRDRRTQTAGRVVERGADWAMCSVWLSLSLALSLWPTDREHQAAPTTAAVKRRLRFLPSFGGERAGPSALAAGRPPPPPPPPLSQQQHTDYTPRLASVPRGHSAGQTALHKRHRSFALQPSGVATGSADAGVGSAAETALPATSSLPPIVPTDRRRLARGLRSPIVEGLGLGYKA